MGISKYFCEYCEKVFNDTPDSRKKHLESRQHKLLVKLHYDSFKDPQELLSEEGNKPPCGTFAQTGSCPYGISCKYSHLPQNYPFQDKLPGYQLRKKARRTANGIPLPRNLPPSLIPPADGTNSYDNSVYQSPEWGW